LTKLTKAVELMEALSPRVVWPSVPGIEWAVAVRLISADSLLESRGHPIGVPAERRADNYAAE
jgi:hypothetical protein